MLKNKAKIGYSA